MFVGPTPDITRTTSLKEAFVWTRSFVAPEASTVCNTLSMPVAIGLLRTVVSPNRLASFLLIPVSYRGLVLPIGELFAGNSRKGS